MYLRNCLRCLYETSYIRTSLPCAECKSYKDNEHEREIPQSQTADKPNRKEELHNNHKTPGRQTEQSNQLSLDADCKTRIDFAYKA